MVKYLRGSYLILPMNCINPRNVFATILTIIKIFSKQNYKKENRFHLFHLTFINLCQLHLLSASLIQSPGRAGYPIMSHEIQFRPQNFGPGDQMIGKPAPLLVSDNTSVWMQKNSIPPYQYYYQIDPAMYGQYSYQTVTLPAGITQQPGQQLMMSGGYSLLLDGQGALIMPDGSQPTTIADSALQTGADGSAGADGTQALIQSNSLQQPPSAEDPDKASSLPDTTVADASANSLSANDIPLDPGLQSQPIDHTATTHDSSLQ